MKEPAPTGTRGFPPPRPVVQPTIQEPAQTEHRPASLPQNLQNEATHKTDFTPPPAEPKPVEVKREPAAARPDQPREKRVVLSPQQETVVQAIVRLQTASGERSVITFRQIAAEAHLSYITVRRAVEALARKGSLQKLVVRTDTSQGAVYTLTNN